MLTKTAVVHERAWKTMFDELLGERGTFEASDYTDFVDGKPRVDGIRAFLASRDIAAGEDEVQTLSQRKNALVLKRPASRPIARHHRGRGGQADGAHGPVRTAARS